MLFYQNLKGSNRKITAFFYWICPIFRIGKNVFLLFLYFVVIKEYQTNQNQYLKLSFHFQCVLSINSIEMALSTDNLFKNLNATYIL